MGRAARWLRGLFGGNKAVEAKSSTKEKKKWGNLVKSFREKERRGEMPPVAASYREVDDDEEQNKRAISVAAEAAAVAEAAVSAALAAAAVVRLTSSGRVFAGKRAEFAVVRIQAAFRAYLARRALRALKGLVKLQAIVRGNIVRKQAAETLRCMHALVRVQAHARACRALRSDRDQLKVSSRTHPGPSTPEKSEQPLRSSIRKPERSSPLKRNSSKQLSPNERLDHERAQSSSSSGLRWLDQWMEERYWDASKSGFVIPQSAPLIDDEKNAKILEIDTGKTNNYTFAAEPDSPSKDSTIAHRSIPSPSSVEQTPSPLMFPIIDGYDYEESPQFFYASSRPNSSRRGPFSTPPKSECSRSLFSGYSDYPNYLANTESSRAKVRSQSAPKQRPEFDKSGSVKRVSGQRLSSYKNYPGSGRLDRLGMPIKI